MKKSVLYFYAIIFFSSYGIKGLCQKNKIDSLQNILISNNITVEKKASTLIELSETYLSNDSKKSIEHGYDAVKTTNTINNNELNAKANCALGNAFSYDGNYDSSYFYLKKSVDLNPYEAIAWFYLGQNEWYNGTENLCTNYYATAEKISIQKNDLKTTAIIYYSLADYYRYTHQDSLAQHYIKLSIKILEKSSLYNDLATAYNVQAEMYRTKGEYKNALETYIKTAKIAYQILDSTRIGYCFSRIGYIYYMQNEFKLAEQFLTKSLEIGEQTESRNLILFSLKSLADMFSNIAQKEKCLYYANRCLEVGLKMNDEPAICLAHSSMSNLYYRLGELDSARINADLAYKYAKENNDIINTVNALLNKIPIEFDSKSYNKVITLTTEGIKLASISNTMEHLKDLYKFRYKAFEKLGNKSASFEAYDQYRMYNDSLNNNDVSLEIKKSELEMSYQDKHLADTLVYIKKTQLARQEILLQKQRSQLIFIAGSIITILLLMIIFIVWSTSKKRKKLNQSLAESNHDKELLLKEIHHRVKNSLQIVSSLLNLQKTQADKKTFNELIDESQIKIANIAIVHELLYQSTSFKTIHLDKYLNTLSNHILKTLSKPESNIQIKQQIENIEISLDKSVPLALIVNEIITNSVKYAFDVNSDGIITITAKQKDEKIEIIITDNGKGLPNDYKNSNGIGLALINGFIKQLKGDLNYGNKNGSFFVISFPIN